MEVHAAVAHRVCEWPKACSHMEKALGQARRMPALPIKPETVACLRPPKQSLGGALTRDSALRLRARLASARGWAEAADHEADVRITGVRGGLKNALHDQRRNV